MRSIGRPKHRWENDIRKDLKEIGWENVNWDYMMWLRVGTV
jgi:hypothetical protein